MLGCSQGRLHRLSCSESGHLVIVTGSVFGALLPQNELLLDHLRTVEVLFIRRFEHLLIDEALEILLGIKDLDPLELRRGKTLRRQAGLEIREGIPRFPVLVDLSGSPFRGLIGNMEKILAFLVRKTVVNIPN